MHKNESCSEDGNYYENQLAELMDLRQAVRQVKSQQLNIPINIMDKNATNNVDHNNNNESYVISRKSVIKPKL